MKPKVLILHASGINRDQETAHACELAGGDPEILHINQLRGSSPTHKLRDYQMLVLAGGFSYGDALGAGRRLALDLTFDLKDELTAFVEKQKPVLGICNGFQTLVKTNLLSETPDTVTLTHNTNGRFECRWVTLVPNPDSPCIYTKYLKEPVYCPIAHGEGRFVSKDGNFPRNRIALQYADEKCQPASGKYPNNPNGSENDIAGICNETGTIMGLMPHPEDHIFNYQHPRWTRGEQGRYGLPLFEAGIRYAADA